MLWPTTSNRLAIWLVRLQDTGGISRSKRLLSVSTTAPLYRIHSWSITVSSRVNCLLCSCHCISVAQFGSVGVAADSVSISEECVHLRQMVPPQQCSDIQAYSIGECTTAAVVLFAPTSLCSGTVQPHASHKSWRYSHHKTFHLEPRQLVYVLPGREDPVSISLKRRTWGVAVNKSRGTISVALTSCLDTVDLRIRQALEDHVDRVDALWSTVDT